MGKINDMAQDKLGFMWFANRDRGSLIRYDGSHMKSFYHDPEDENTLGGSYPECLWVDKDGIIWVGFWGQGLDRFDPATNTFTHYRHDPSDSLSLSENHVTDITGDHLGNLWVGTWDGLNKLDPGSGKFTRFRYDPDDPGSISHDAIRVIYMDQSETLWIGTGDLFDYEEIDGGLNRFDPHAGSFTRYLHDPADPGSLIANQISAMLEDSQGNFWVGTVSNGLHIMDRDRGTFKRYDQASANQHDLGSSLTSDPASFISFLAEDMTGHIWIGTFDEGVIRYDLQSGNVKKLDDSAGLKDAVFDNPDWRNFAAGKSFWSIYSSRDGLIWISTERGSTKLFKVDLFHNDISPTGKGFVSAFVEEPTNTLWIGLQQQGLIRQDMVTGTTKMFRNIPGDSTSLSNNNINSVMAGRDGMIWVGTSDGLNVLDPSKGTFQRYMYKPEDSLGLNSRWINNVFEDSRGNMWLGGSNGVQILEPKTGRFRVFTSNPEDPTTISGDMVYPILEDNQGYIWIGAWAESAGLSRFDPDNNSWPVQILLGNGPF